MAHKIVGTCLHKWLRTPAPKVRLVADLVRGESVDAALRMLPYVQKSGAEWVYKGVKAASANAMSSRAEDAPRIRPEDLYIAEIFVNEGMAFKRFQAASMGRAGKIKKRTSHLTVKVAVRPTVVATPEPTEA